MPQVLFYITHRKITDNRFECIILCQIMCKHSPELRAEAGTSYLSKKLRLDVKVY